jgi:hypothetical protein
MRSRFWAYFCVVVELSPQRKETVMYDPANYAAVA